MSTSHAIAHTPPRGAMAPIRDGETDAAPTLAFQENSPGMIPIEDTSITSTEGDIDSLIVDLAEQIEQNQNMTNHPPM